MEQWDAYLPDGRKADSILTRGEPVPSGLYHIVSDVLVKHTDGDYLVMQRDFRKLHFSGQFDAGACGAVLKGETPYEGAMRELQEETGIQADALTFLFAVSNLQETLSFCYLCLTDCDKSSITLQEGETISYQWLTKDEFMRFVRTPEFAHSPKARWLPYLAVVSAFGE